MPDVNQIKQITLPNGTTYDIVDAGARSLIDDLSSYTNYLGVTTTALADGSTTNPVTIDGESVTAVTGNIVNYGSKEFIFNGTAWQEFGDLSGLGDLAFEDSVPVTGTAAAQTFTGTQDTINSSATYTPAGNVSLTTTSTSVATGVNTTTANIAEFDEAGSVTAGSAASFTQGTDSFTATVTNEVLTLDFTQGTDTFTANTPTSVTLPTSKMTTVIASASADTSNIDLPTSASFTGTQDTINSSATYTPAGTNGASTVTGTAAPSGD